MAFEAGSVSLQFSRFQVMLQGTVQRLVKNRFKEMDALGLGVAKLRFQLVAQGKQFIDFGDNSMLLRYWWQRESK